MTPALVLNLLAWAALAASAFVLLRKKRITDALVIGCGVILMAIAGLTMTFASVARTPGGEWPSWFWVVGSFGPIGILLVAIATLRICTSLSRN